MAEYIEREAALIICEKEYQERLKMQDWCGDTVAWNIGHAIKAIQTADVVPVVHGRWLYAINTRRRYAPVADDMICSACNRVTERLDGINYLYCPYCGARMEGE